MDNIFDNSVCNQVNSRRQTDPYKWRREHLDMYREQQKIYQRKTYKDYYDTVRKDQKKIYYQYKKTVKGMMAMMDNLVQSTDGSLGG